MSKLADKIKRATRTQAQAIGFGAAKSASEPTMVLAGLARDAKSAADLIARGADVVVLGSAGSPPDASAGAAVRDAIAGARIKGRADNEARSYREGGFDFVVFDPNSTAATSVLDEEIGYVISIPDDLSDNELRTLEAFQLDALDIGTIDGALTVRRQIGLRRIYALTRKPLMARVNAQISTAELQALRDTNVVVVAAEGAGDVERLRKTIDALPPRTRRRDGDDRPTPLVPRAAVAEDGAGEDDDDD